MKPNQRGFTLLEVMVALAILALTLGAMIQTGGASARNVAMLRDQTLASWVALNQVNEALLVREWPEPGIHSDTSLLANREWYWELRVIKTSDPELRRLEVAVRDQKDAAPLVELIAFKGRPNADAADATATDQAKPGERSNEAATKASGRGRQGPSRPASR